MGEEIEKKLATKTMVEKTAVWRVLVVFVRAGFLTRRELRGWLWKKLFWVEEIDGFLGGVGGLAWV